MNPCAYSALAVVSCPSVARSRRRTRRWTPSCWRRNGVSCSARRSSSCRRTAASSSPPCSKIRPRATLSSLSDSGCRSGALDPPGHAAWRSCAGHRRCVAWCGTRPTQSPQEVPTVEPLSTDDDLLRELSAALAEADVPPAVRAEGYAAWTWRDIDSELASLVYDSAVDPRLSALTRAIAAPRTLVFRTDDLAVELELAGRALVGQVVPPGPGEVELLSPAGETRSTPVDGAGRF